MERTCCACCVSQKHRRPPNSPLFVRMSKWHVRVPAFKPWCLAPRGIYLIMHHCTSKSSIFIHLASRKTSLWAAKTPGLKPGMSKRCVSAGSELDSNLEFRTNAVPQALGAAAAFLFRALSSCQSPSWKQEIGRPSTVIDLFPSHVSKRNGHLWHTSAKIHVCRKTSPNVHR